MPVATLVLAYWLVRIGRDHLWPSLPLLNDDFLLFVLLALYWFIALVVSIEGVVSLWRWGQKAFLNLTKDHASIPPDGEILIEYSMARTLKTAGVLVLVWGAVSWELGSPSYWLMVFLAMVLMIQSSHFLVIDLKKGMLQGYRMGMVTVTLPLSMIETAAVEGRKLSVETTDGARYRFPLDRYPRPDRRLLRSVLVSHDMDTG